MILWSKIAPLRNFWALRLSTNSALMNTWKLFVRRQIANWRFWQGLLHIRIMESGNSTECIFNAQPSYSQLIWMLHSCRNNNKIKNYVKDVSSLSTIANTLDTKNFHKKVNQFLPTIKMLKNLPLRGLKSKML